MAKPRILIVEDEPAIRDNIQFALESEGFETTSVATGGVVLPMLEQDDIALLVLDVGLPDVSGLDLVKQIRKQHTTPIILLTARSSELDRVLGLEMGADDYVAKPFSPRELAARVKAVLRRGRPQMSSSSESWAVNTSKRQISFWGQALTLSKFEYEILTTFIARPGHVFSREQLMRMVWEQPETSLDRTVDAHIKNIRAKLRAVRDDLDPIVTHRGTGYSLRDDA